MKHSLPLVFIMNFACANTPMRIADDAQTVDQGVPDTTLRDTTLPDAALTDASLTDVNPSRDVSIDSSLDPNSLARSWYEATVAASTAECRCTWQRAGYASLADCIGPTNPSSTTPEGVACRATALRAASPASLAYAQCLANAWTQTDSCLRAAFTQTGTCSYDACSDTFARCQVSDTAGWTAFRSAMTTCIVGTAGTCPTASGHAVPFTWTTTNFAAGDDYQLSCRKTGDSEYRGADVTYRFTADVAGLYRFDTSGSSIDTVLGLFNDCDGEFSCADDVGTRLTEFAEINLATGQNVTVVVDANRITSANQVRLTITRVGN